MPLLLVNYWYYYIQVLLWVIEHFAVRGLLFSPVWLERSPKTARYQCWIWPIASSVFALCCSSQLPLCISTRSTLGFDQKNGKQKLDIGLPDPMGILWWTWNFQMNSGFPKLDLCCRCRESGISASQHLFQVSMFSEMGMRACFFTGFGLYSIDKKCSDFSVW